MPEITQVGYSEPEQDPDLLALRSRSFPQEHRQHNTLRALAQPLLDGRTQARCYMSPDFTMPLKAHRSAPAVSAEQFFRTFPFRYRSLTSGAILHIATDTKGQ